MSRILAGIETEYGLAIEGRGPEDQVQDAAALVASFPDPCFVGWDARWESPRSDLRGYSVERLATDPQDAAFDRNRPRHTVEEERADRMLANGARLYNDHGHPEYATPECWSLDELVRQDAAGELAVLLSARAYEAATGRQARVFKNNSDYSGASYGCHESYLVSRSLGFEALYAAVTPVLVARTLLCGAGKVGAESGPDCRYQLSQRADFMSTSAGVDTLYRRPVFNTRDESHADPAKWIRLHVISGDANRMPQITRWKVGLVKIALGLAMRGDAPDFPLADPPGAFLAVSRDPTKALSLTGKPDTTARQVLDAYLERARNVDDDELARLAHELRDALEGNDLAARTEWGLKFAMLEGYGDWDEETMRSLELQYHLVDPRESLFEPLCELHGIPTPPDPHQSLRTPGEPTRALARSAAVTCLPESLQALSWGTLTIDGKTTHLPPDRDYSDAPAMATDSATFVKWLQDA